mmetsp:Transcript_13575/g.16303  ORF Transcript_13575/g.16303 Transcript_13575/m.16303 type:complete len:100 (-) Transcript_13575:129-428(-)
MSEIPWRMQEMQSAPQVEQQSVLTVVVVGTIGRASLGSARAANLHGPMLEAAKAAEPPRPGASRKATSCLKEGDVDTEMKAPNATCEDVQLYKLHQVAV